MRSGDALRSALGKATDLRGRLSKVGLTGTSKVYDSGLTSYLEAQSLAACAEVVLASALAREESRGAHSRVDFPDKDKEWGRLTVVLKRGSNGNMEVRRDPLPPVREDLQKIIEEQG